MLSRSLIKLINSLKHKKYRQKYGLFVAEGRKIVNDLLTINAKVKTIISVDSKFETKGVEFIASKESELRKISFLKNSSEVIALVEIPNYQIDENEILNTLSIGLDGVQDPGNLGTIIRVANWFGINNIFCSYDCADIYNPKVVQASMGALMGTKVHYVDLAEKISQLKKSIEYQIYGTFMQGESIFQSDLIANGLILMGNEGKGISRQIEELIIKRIAIPSFAVGSRGAESLNVGVATGIIISEFARQRTK